jgi:hypothetical protein
MLSTAPSEIIPSDVLQAMRAADRDPRRDYRPRSDFLR